MAKIVFAAALATLALFASLDLTHAEGFSSDLTFARYRPPSNGSIVSCNILCVRKAAAPRPGDNRPRGYLDRICTNNLTGKTVSWSPVVPATPCR